MSIYDSNLMKLSAEDEMAFMEQWAIDGLDQPRTRPYLDGHIILSQPEIADLLSEWAEASRPRTAEEIDAKKTIEADIENKFDSTLKAFALVVLSEINVLRVQAALPERTVQQLKDAVKSRL